MNEKNQDEVVVEAIKVKLGGKVETLTLDQARKLHAELGKLFGAQREVVHKHEHEYVPYSPWRPYWYSGTLCSNDKLPEPTYQVFCASSATDATKAVNALCIDLDTTGAAR